jgi:hypothetical protein
MQNTFYSVASLTFPSNTEEEKNLSHKTLKYTRGRLESSLRKKKPLPLQENTRKINSKLLIQKHGGQSMVEHNIDSAEKRLFINWRYCLSTCGNNSDDNAH